MQEELKFCANQLIEDTLIAMEEYHTPEMAFTASVLDKIEDRFNCDEIIKEHCRLTKSNGTIFGEIYAYGLSENKEVLYLFYTDYNSCNEIKIKSNTESQISLNRPQTFYNQAIRGAHLDLKEDGNEYQALKFIYDNNQSIQSVKIIVLSNYIINSLSLKKKMIASRSVFFDVWDLKKIFGFFQKPNDHFPIDIDFNAEEYERYKIPFIQMESSQYGYKCIQAMFPAKLLFQLYEKYNTLLLYNNVRYFLGLTGQKEKKPNVAMLNTLRTENEMFLAYNNGITALAKGVESDLFNQKTDITDPENMEGFQYISCGILKKILDFRIINGGQTTAVLYNAKCLSNGTKDESKKVNLLGVYVQVKLIISDEIEKISGNIALSSNFQNKVKYSDFSVGNIFNTTLEKLSRTIIAPNLDDKPEYWFYERLRGQYDEQRKKIRTAIEKSLFESKFPKKRKFSKEDVAKIWKSWDQTPYDAVKGASTSYLSFMKKVQEENIIPDEKYYKETIALLIIYRYLMNRPENRNYANGKATVVAYAIALLEYYTLGKFDLIKVWDNQGISDSIKKFLDDLCDEIYNSLDAQAKAISTSILSYGKTKAAYNYVKGINLNIDKALLINDSI